MDEHIVVAGLSRQVHTLVPRHLLRQFISRIGMAHDAERRVRGQNALDATIGFLRTVAHDYLSGVDAVTDSDPAPVVLGLLPVREQTKSMKSSGSSW